MVDLIINKYLETQLALAKRKQQTKSSKNDLVSEKSKNTAERISRKQDRSVSKSKNNETITGDDELLKPNSSSVKKDTDSEDEYMPSCDEDDGEIHLPTLATTSRGKHNLKKIIDDGDKSLYDIRIQTWRKILSEIKGTSKCDPGFHTADIDFVLNGNQHCEENHELQNGLLVPNYIWKQLYKYQRTGVKWLWELHQIQSGGMLGDEMGLGKTVQIIAFLAGLFTTDIGRWGGLGPTIIVAPATVIYQWVSHFHYWLPQLRVAVLHHSGSHGGNHDKLITDLHTSHGILLITYAGIVKYTDNLLAKKWHYIILDEGHKIRNPETQVSKLVKKFQTPHKLLITGSPMQNSLQELWSLFDFMRPGLLGTHAAFMEHFAIPITQGGYANATEMQEATALEISKALKNIITPYMLRRTKAEVQECIKLPEKNEQVLFCALSQEQRDLYLGYLMSTTVRSILDKETKSIDPFRARVLVALSTLRKICNHPDLYLYEAQEECEEIDENNFGHWKRSGKMIVVHSLLRIWNKQGHRALIFSQSRAMLCILEQYLQNHEFKYLKMDGSVSVSQRQNLIKTFNDDSEYLVFLATTRVGGLGVNLTGADRVIIFDPDWNPATDNQAKERAWRIGQLRNVTVYRLLCAGTIEEKIYQRQIFKNFLGNKILIDPNQKNVLSTSTLQGLFTLEEPNCEGDTETASLFKHTKVKLKEEEKGKHDIHISGGVSFSKKKLDAMRRMAKDISNKISQNCITKLPKESGNEDPRERYKKKRDAILHPPMVEEPQINIVDDKVTSVGFENALSELDIINKHIKKDYEENLIKEVMSSKEKEVSETESLEKVDTTENKNKITDNMHKTSKNDSSVVLDEAIAKSKFTKEHSSKKSRKRRHSPSLEKEIDNLVAVKKVKYKKEKNKKLKDDDDYVLTKLFAKAAVKNALQHDVVVGLAEKEKRHRMKEEAEKQAKKAIRAIKFSSK